MALLSLFLIFGVASWKPLQICTKTIFVIFPSLLDNLLFSFNSFRTVLFFLSLLLLHSAYIHTEIQDITRGVVLLYGIPVYRLSMEKHILRSLIYSHQYSLLRLQQSFGLDESDLKMDCLFALLTVLLSCLRLGHTRMVAGERSTRSRHQRPSSGRRGRVWT